jgi:VWFA-related protein
VIIYPIGLGGAFSGVARGVLKDFARETGGRGFFPDKAKELPAVYAQIAEELRNQYYLTYSSDNETFDGRWIKIKLEAKTKGLKATTRRGYYAVRD